MAVSAASVRPDTLPPQAITLTEEERTSGRLSASHKDLATFLLACRGYVILKDAMPMGFQETLRREFEAIFADCRATLGTEETGTDPDAVHKVSVSKQKGASFWFRKARWRIFPRLVGPMGDPLLLANPFVMPILEDLLGPKFTCRYLSSDTCVNGAILQSPHSDILMNDAFVENHWRARGYVVNVPITECGLHNGPMEIWPGGSHLWTSDMMHKHSLEPYVQDGRNPPVERLAEYCPSLKVAFKPGEILVRDLAMWHRGTPNPTEEPRTMLTLGYFRGGYEYGYADPRHNVDFELYKKLDPQVRPMFDFYFTLKRRLRRKQRELEAQARTAVERWKNARA